MQMDVVEVEALQLPDIVTRVLQHVDTHQRITCCSLVSRTWNTAAGAATTSIHVRQLLDSKVTSLQEWLARHGSHLTSLTSISSSSFSLVCKIAPCLRQLRQLQLSSVELTASLVQRDISLLSCSLTALTGLYLDFHQIEPQAVSSLRFLSSLDTLQDFRFSSAPILAELTAADPCYLPPSLTRLEIFDWRKERKLRVPAGTASVWPLLTNLRHLYVLENAQGPPSIQLGISVLSCLSQLTKLVYEVIGDAEWSVTDTTTFLSGVRHLSRLQHLDVGYTLKAASPVIEQYSALTTSSSLTHLTLSWCRVPGDYLHHMLPLGRQFTALKVLNLGWQRVVGKKARGSLTHIITTCPNLQELTVSCSARESAQLQQLSQLSTLTSLTVSSQNFNRGFVPALMQLAELRELSLWQYKSDVTVDNETSDADGVSESDSNEVAGSLSPATLVELRHLKQLTKLDMGEELCPEASVPAIWLVEKPLSPEVWEQFITRLMDIPQLACLLEHELQLS